jgi:ANTAR domain
VSSHPNLELVDYAPAERASLDGHGPGVNGQGPPSDELAELAAELEGLQQRLKTLPVIEQSKGLLIGHYGVDADTALVILRRWSSHTNLKLRVISQYLVAAASRPRPSAPSGSSSRCR